MERGERLTGHTINATRVLTEFLMAHSGHLIYTIDNNYAKH